jgi:glycosyltransferase involved in cell wall biosynthesis
MPLQRDRGIGFRQWVSSRYAVGIERALSAASLPVAQAWATQCQMRHGTNIAVVIPALNEEAAIGRVVADIPTWVDRVVIADNGSTDRTADVARAAGAVVIAEPEKGYGAACLAGIAATGDAGIIVFMDGDHSDFGEDMAQLVDPILAGTADFVLASRALGAREKGSLTPQQQFGNWLATTLIRLIWRTRYTDLGPYRAISQSALAQLGMADRNYGWTVEMQIKAVERGLRVLEVPGRYRVRIGQSKVSGTIKGSVMAGYKILSIIGRHALRRETRQS